MDAPSGAGADRARDQGLADPVCSWPLSAGLGLYRPAADAPGRRAAREAAVRAWLENTDPAIARKAKAQGCEIQWADETGLSNQANYGRSFAPRGQTPIIQRPARRLRWYRRGGDLDGSWRVDETYVKVKGEWKYLYRAVNAHDRTIDFYLSSTRTISAATIFLKKALRAAKDWNQPHTITTDRNPTYGVALAQINEERTEAELIRHRMAKYLNNIIEADHGKLKRLIKPTLGFKSMKTAHATLKGFEVMRMFRKRQFHAWFQGAAGIAGEVRLINRQFGIYAI